MQENLLKGPFSYEQIIVAAKEYGEYINAVRFLIITYCDNRDIKEALVTLSEAWQDFLKPLSIYHKDDYNKLVLYNELPSGFMSSCFKWETFAEFYKEDFAEVSGALSLLTENQENERSEYEKAATRIPFLTEKMNFVVKCKDTTLENVSFQDYSIKLFDILKEIESLSSTCIRILEGFEIDHVNVFQSQKKLKMRLIQIRDSITKYNYFTAEIISYFQLERSNRAIYKLNLKDRYNVGLFKKVNAHYQDTQDHPKPLIKLSEQEVKHMYQKKN